MNSFFGSITQIGPDVRLERHRHRASYAALVLNGGYLEAGDSGRFYAGPGDVVFHDCFEAHQDMFGTSRTALINLPIAEMPLFARGRLADVDAIVRLAIRDINAASDLLLASVCPDLRREKDWPDDLAADLVSDQFESLSAWADAKNLHPASVSKGFRRAYGISPQRFRLEARAKQAVRGLTDTSAGLAQIAADSGFSDQPHMTRTIRMITDATPSALRTGQAKYVQ